MVNKRINDLESENINDNQVIIKDGLKTSNNTVGALVEYMRTKIVEELDDSVGEWVYGYQDNALARGLLEPNGDIYLKSDYPKLVELWNKIYGENGVNLGSTQQNWYGVITGTNPDNTPIFDTTKFKVPNLQEKGEVLRGISSLYNYTAGEFLTDSIKSINNIIVNSFKPTGKTNSFRINWIADFRPTSPEESLVFAKSNLKLYRGPNLLSGATVGTKYYGYYLEYDKTFSPTLDIQQISGLQASYSGGQETRNKAFIQNLYIRAKPKIGISQPPSPYESADVLYNNENSTLLSSSVQDCLDEIDIKINNNFNIIGIFQAKRYLNYEFTDIEKIVEFTDIDISNSNNILQAPENNGLYEEFVIVETGIYDIKFNANILKSGGGNTTNVNIYFKVYDGVEFVKVIESSKVFTILELQDNIDTKNFIFTEYLEAGTRLQLWSKRLNLSGNLNAVIDNPDSGLSSISLIFSKK